MIYDVLSEENFLLYAARHSDCYDSEEFLEDLKRFKYIKKLITRYKETGDLKERLILNHIIVLNNIFGPVALPRMLYLKLKSEMAIIKPFLILLNILPEHIINVFAIGAVDTSDITMDNLVIEKLRSIIHESNRST